ncbi:MAG: biopolymer transporter ExbD [Deltaproteobacteria bacterium]|nr:biopolymer transporter ExbD [Deltaproteobacteria bacterium]
MRLPPTQEVNLELTPMMNLLTGLVPFMLMSAAFFQLSVIQISVPVASSTGETDIAKEEDAVTLNLRITATTFDLSASSDTLSPTEVKKLKASIPRVHGDDAAERAVYQQVSEAAYQIKGKYTASDTVIVVPDPEIPYEVVVASMDAVRDIVQERGGLKSKVTLFPRVVLSSMVK